MSIARNYKEGVHPPFIDSVGGAQAGQVLVWDAPSTSLGDPGDPQAKLPTGTAPQLLSPAGINESAGFVGGAGTVAGDPVATTRQGLTKAKLTTLLAVTRGQPIEADPGTLGNVRGRTPYSRSGWVLGTAEEARTAGSTDEDLEIYAQPYFVECVRQVTGQCTGTVTAATKYLTAPGSTVAAAQIPLYCARFAGETIRNLNAWATTAPGGADTGIYTVQKSSDNGATWTDTTLTATISAAGKAASDLTHAVVLAAGDLLAIKVVSSNTTLAGCGATFDVT